MNKEIETPEGYEARIEGNKVILEPKESEDEKIRKQLIGFLSGRYALCNINTKDAIAYLEQQKEQKPKMIQWTGNNFKEVIDFTGKSQKFGEWFKSWEEFENYVHSHGDILKLFCEDGSHYEVPVGAWIVKTPDGYNTPSSFRFIQKPAEWSDEEIVNWAYDNFRVSSFDMTKIVTNFSSMDELERSLREKLNSLRPQPKQEWSETDKLHLNNAILVAKKEWGVNSYTARFLESLRDNCKKCNNHWKPSEEQIEAVEEALEFYSGTTDTAKGLRSLYNDLKKL